ncbi:MAG: hypothetical protein R3C26_07505 [Calditrichia bacterium]
MRFRFRLLMAAVWKLRCKFCGQSTSRKRNVLALWLVFPGAVNGMETKHYELKFSTANAAATVAICRKMQNWLLKINFIVRT